MKKTYPIWIALAVAVIVLVIFAAGGSLYAFTSVPSILLVILLSLALSLCTHGFREIGKSFQAAFPRSSAGRAEVENALLFFKALQRYLLVSGLVGTLTGGVAMLANLEDASSIGPNLSLALLTLYYGLLCYLFLCVPFVTALRKRLLHMDT